MSARLRSEVVAESGALGALAPEWDELACRAGLPLMAPAWVLAWWRHLAPAGAQPRVVVVRDGERLIGLAPFYVEAGRGRTDYRLPGVALGARLAPLAVANREWDVAGAVAEALAQASPRPDMVALEALPLAAHWPIALRDRWPGRVRPVVRQYNVFGAPAVRLDHASFDDWLASRSSNFRAQMRRLRRQFEAAGGVVRHATPETLDRDVATLLRLHAARWDGRGASNLVALGDGVAAMLRDAGRALPAGRFRLLSLEIAGAPASVQLFLEAGGEVLYFNAGWDEAHAALKPAMLGILQAIEDAHRRGDGRMDLGLGDQAYKLRFADGNDPVAWSVVVPPGRRQALALATVAPVLVRAWARDAAKRALSEARVDRVRALRDAVSPGAARRAGRRR